MTAKHEVPKCAPATAPTAAELVAQGMREIVALEAARYIRDSANQRPQTMKTDPIDAAMAEHEEFLAGWTELDRRIVAHDFLNWQFGMPAGVRSMIEGDRIDARAMLAIENLNETMHRIAGTLPLTPGDRVEGFGDTGLRENMEHINGESLL